MTFLRNVAAAAAISTCSMGAFAADYTDGDTHKNDYKWMQFNLMYAVDELPGESSHEYMEMEFGGRSGIFDLYGYVDVFNLANQSGNEKANADRAFLKFAPRMSLDGLTGKDLSFGPVEELYVATLFTMDGGRKYNYVLEEKDDEGNNKTASNTPGYSAFVGLGSDVMVPWFGKMGLNFYALYDMNAKDWNGFQISTNWFKPFYHFDNGSFLSYQGYIDYQFGADDTFHGRNQSTNGGAMFNGLYWHSNQFAAGYGLKLYNDVYLIEDSSGFKSSGAAHYFAVTYKF